MPQASDPFEGVYETLARLRRERRVSRGVRARAASRCVAFSRRDTNHPGFTEAAAVAEEAGFLALVRPVGGTFVPLDEGSLIVDEFGYSQPGEWPEDRYRRHVDALVSVLADWGVDPRVGELPGEYCPGRYSVNHAGRFKISGTAQRVSGGAWLVSSVVRIAPMGPLIPVLDACSRALKAELISDMAGSVARVTAAPTMNDATRDMTARFVNDGAGTCI